MLVYETTYSKFDIIALSFNVPYPSNNYNSTYYLYNHFLVVFFVGLFLTIKLITI